MTDRCSGEMANWSRWLVEVMPLRSVHGPDLPFITTSKCCGAARQSGHSLQLQNLQAANSQTADEAAVQIDMYEVCFPPHSCHSMRSIVPVSSLSRICWPQFKAALAGPNKFAISPLVVLSASRAFEDLR